MDPKNTGSVTETTQDAPPPVAENPHWGRCEFFDPKPFLDSASILVAGDEPLRALELLDHLPGYYRNFPPPEIQELKRQILKLLATPSFYMKNPSDERILDPAAALRVLRETLRGILIERDIKTFNEQDRIPHLQDLGPGEYWLPLALAHAGYRFTYQDQGLHPSARIVAQVTLPDRFQDQPKPDQPVIFVACELIEHLHHERDLRVDFERMGGNADIVHFSTPNGTFDGRKERLNWKNFGDLGHLRTYTADELTRVICSMFPEYRFELCEHQILHMRGSRISVTL